MSSRGGSFDPGSDGSSVPAGRWFKFKFQVTGGGGFTLKRKPYVTGTSPFKQRSRRNKPPLVQLAELYRPLDRGVSNQGILSPAEPYQGPREFALARDLRIKARGKVRRVFWVRRDESLHPPYGGFRIYYEDQEIGRVLGFPTIADCIQAKRNAGRRRNETQDQDEVARSA